MSDLDEDMQIAVRALRFLISVAPLGVLGVPRQRGAWESSLLLVADVALLFRFSDPPSRIACLTLLASLRRCSRVYFPAPLTSLRQLPKLNATMPVNDMTLDSDWFSWTALSLCALRCFAHTVSFLSNQLLAELLRTGTRRTTSIHIDAPAGRRACSRTRSAAAGQGDHGDRAVHRAARGTIQRFISACDRPRHAARQRRVQHRADRGGDAGSRHGAQDRGRVRVSSIVRVCSCFFSLAPSANSELLCVLVRSTIDMHLRRCSDVLFFDALDAYG